MATFQGPGIRVLKQYQAEDGKTYVQLSTGETLATDSEDYQIYYDDGVLYGEDEKGNFYPQEGAHDTLKQYQELTKNNSFENYMKPYFEDELTGSIAKGMGQSADRFWDVNSSYKQNYDAQMQQDFVSQILSQNPMSQNGDNPEDRGSYFDRVTGGMPNEVRDYIMQSGNPGVQPSYWQDFSRGAYTIGNEILPDFLGGGDQGLMKSITDDPSYTSLEKSRKQEAISKGEYGFMDRTMDELGILSPLAVPAKMVQSAYRDDYSLGNALSGNKNNAGILEDVVTDPLTYLGIGNAKNVSKLSRINENNLLQLAKEEPLNLIPGRAAKAQQALEEGNQWSRNWYNAPETQTRIDRIQNQYNGAFSDLIENNKEATSTQIHNTIGERDRVNNFWNQFRNNIDDESYKGIFQSNQSKVDRLLEGEPHIHSGNSGVSYGEYSNPDKYQPMNPNGTQNFVNQFESPERISSTAVHEGNHGIFTPRMSHEMRSFNFNEMMQEPFQGGMKAGLINDYYSDPMEIYARTQEFRRANNIKPGQKVSEIEVDKMRKSGNNKEIGAPFMRFDSKKMANLLNTLPGIGAGIGVPAWLLNQQNETNPDSTQ